MKNLLQNLQKLLLEMGITDKNKDVHGMLIQAIAKAIHDRTGLEFGTRSIGAAEDVLYRVIVPLGLVRQLRLCHGNSPLYESAPQYENDSVVDVWTYLECHHCHAMTKPFHEAAQAESAWNAGEVTIPDWAKK